MAGPNGSAAMDAKPPKPFTFISSSDSIHGMPAIKAADHVMRFAVFSIPDFLVAVYYKCSQKLDDLFFCYRNPAFANTFWVQTPKQFSAATLQTPNEAPHCATQQKQ